MTSLFSRRLTPGRPAGTPAIIAGWAARYRAAAFLFFAVLALWEAAARGFAIPAWLLPSPSLIAQTIVARRHTLWTHALATFPTVVAGFALAFAVGVTLAVVIRSSPVVARALYPWLLVNQTVPTLAVAPVLVTWLGFTVQAKLLIVVLICFFPICVNAVDGFRSVDPEMVQLMRTLGASSRRIFWEVEVPSALPFLFSGTKVAVSVSVVAAVVSEWVGASEGLGYLVARSAAQLATAQVFAALFLLSAMGIGLFALVSALERLALPWYFDEKRRQVVGD